MTDDTDESRTTTITTTFRFASGQILTANEYQIEKIPYLTAIVSSADRFESARDEDGHYKLDSNINYQHFSFVLKSLQFHSVRQLFTCLPEQNDVIPIIALLDFLGLGPQPNPTLKEVDSTFFSNVVYQPLLEKHLRVIKPGEMQDVAVRFAIAMAKEEYDFTKCEVMDQIYWFIMFILSTPKWFEPRLRHHVYKIGEHCYYLFKPSLLKSLRKLKHSSQKEARRFCSTIYEANYQFEDEELFFFEQVLNQDFYDESNESYFFRWLWKSFKKQNGSLIYPVYEPPRWYRYDKPRCENDLLTPAYEDVLEIMYERLQTIVCQNAIIELRQRKNSYESVQRRIPLPSSFYLHKREVLPQRIADIFKDELVQEEIRAIILEEICILAPKLEQEHAKLLKKIQEHEQNLEISHGPNYRIVRWRTPTKETMQEEAFSHELTLSKLYQNPNIIVEQLQKRVLDGLHKAALKQFNKWENTQRDIDELHWQINSYQQLKNSSSIASKKPMHQQYQTSVHKPLLKRQFKYSTR